MSDRKSINWLYRQLPDLIDKGVIDAATAARLRGYFGPEEEKPDYNLAYILAGVLGAVLIGGGIILIFAFNWDQLSRTWRTILSLAPLVVAQLIYSYVFFRKSHSLAWVESSSGFLMLMIAASIALISQTYHIEGTTEGFLFVWMLLSVPLMYLMNSTLAALFYLVGICAWAVNIWGSESVYYWFFLSFSVPHIIYNTRTVGSPRGNLLGWTFVITLAISWFAVIEVDLPLFSLVGSAFSLSVLYLVGDRWYPSDNTIVSRPFQAFAVVGIFIFCMILGYDWPNESAQVEAWVNGLRYAPWAGKMNFLIWVSIATSWVFLMISGYRKEGRIPPFASLFPLLVFGGFWITRRYGSLVPIILANLYLFVFGLHYIRRGINRQAMTLVNLGMFFIAALIVARFFDTDWSFVVKGVVFVVLGLCFLGVNLLLSRRLKQVEGTEQLPWERL
ncbi:MAG: DUF2157 domain-containing protein [Bacteroidota bacterium]